MPASQHRPGLIQHTFGWPLDHRTYGGSWMYHFGENLVSYGFVVGLDYPNTWLSPFDEMQRLKTHPAIRPHLEGGRRISYGARALSEGGLQSIPRLTFPGGALIGDAAGFLNVPKIKGTHAAMKSGMLAAEAVAEALSDGRPAEPASFTARVRASWLWQELRGVRNIRPAFAKYGTIAGAAYSGLDAMLLRGRAPWTLRHRHADHAVLDSAAASAPIDYPKPDGRLTFDRSSSVFLSNTNHAEDQPVHLVLRDPARWRAVNWDRFRSPESRYCPAGRVRGGGRRAPGRRWVRTRCRGRGCRSTRRTACTARRATSRTRPRTSTGRRPRAAAAPTTSAGCETMKLLVPVKRVLDYNVKPRVRADGSGVDLAGSKMSMNPFDEIAVEEAVRLRERGVATEIVAVSIGVQQCQETLRTALAMGADRALLVLTEAAPEPLAVAKLLRALVLREAPRLVIMGKQAIDDDMNATGQMLAGLLGWAQATFASRVEVEGDGLPP